MGRIVLLCILFPWAAFGPEGNHNPAGDRTGQVGSQGRGPGIQTEWEQSEEGTCREGRQNPIGTKTRRYCLSPLSGARRRRRRGFCSVFYLCPSTWWARGALFLSEWVKIAGFGKSFLFKAHALWILEGPVASRPRG